MEEYAWEWDENDTPVIMALPEPDELTRAEAKPLHQNEEQEDDNN